MVNEVSRNCGLMAGCSKSGKTLFLSQVIDPVLESDDKNYSFVDFTVSEEEIDDTENSEGEQDLFPIINNGSTLPDPVNQLSLLDNIDESNSDNYSADELLFSLFFSLTFSNL